MFVALIFTNLASHIKMYPAHNRSGIPIGGLTGFTDSGGGGQRNLISSYISLPEKLKMCDIIQTVYEEEQAGKSYADNLLLQPA